MVNVIFRARNKCLGTAVFIIFLVHPSFKPRVSLWHRVSSVVRRLPSVHNSQEMLLSSQFLALILVWFAR